MPRGLKSGNDKFSQINCIIGANLKHEREIRGYSQTALGRAIGLSYQQIQKYENGKSRISMATLYLICNALDVPMSAFLQDIETVQKPAYNSRFFLNKKELELLSLYKNLDPSAQKTAREFFKAISPK